MLPAGSAVAAIASCRVLAPTDTPPIGTVADELSASSRRPPADTVDAFCWNAPVADAVSATPDSEVR